MRWTTARAAVLWVSLSGCGASVSIGAPEGGVDGGLTTDAPPPVDRPLTIDVPVVPDRPALMDVAVTPDLGPPGCVLPGGGLCAVGARCPAGDGCNTCVCAAGGALACTEIACVRDAGTTTCRGNVDCAAGEICIGDPGCATPWTCRPQTSPCTRDLATWCGCDGTTFMASASCPGRPYLRAGACSAAVITCALPSGARCLLGMTCPSGDGCNDCTCAPPGVLRCTTRPCAFDAGPPRPDCSSTLDCREGEECAGPEGCAAPWTCRAATDRFCPTDAVAWCGCDGRTFYGSSLCPPQRYASRGECGALDAGAGPSFDCDPRHTECGGIPGPCPAGQVRAVAGGCWTSCVDFAGCAPITCDPAVSSVQCPTGTFCSPTTRTCQLPTR